VREGNRQERIGSDGKNFNLFLSMLLTGWCWEWFISTNFASMLV